MTSPYRWISVTCGIGRGPHYSCIHLVPQDQSPSDASRIGDFSRSFPRPGARPISNPTTAAAIRLEAPSPTCGNEDRQQ